MGRFVGLLYSVVLGEKRRLTSAQLLEAAARAGFVDARTVIATGNVVFTADGEEGPVAERLSAAVATVTGRAIPAFCRSADAFLSLGSRNPFAASNPADVGVRVMAAPPDAATFAAALTRARPGEAAQHVGREVWALTPGGFAGSPMARLLSSSKLGAGTWRSASAVGKIAAALAG